MAERMNNPLSTLRPGGYVNYISLGAMMRPPLSMPHYRGQTEERTLLGGAYQSPIHSPSLPAGMQYGTGLYDSWRASLMKQRALQQGISPEILPDSNPDIAAGHLDDFSWDRGEAKSQKSTDRGALANESYQSNQLRIERELWNKNLQERFGRR